MTLDRDTLYAVVDELQPLVGARIQRVDVVAEREVSLELRVPGRTLHLVLSARASLGRVALVGRRPTKEIPGGQLQAILRARLTGQHLLRLLAEDREVVVDTPRARLTVRLAGGKAAFSILPAAEDLPDRIEPIPIPDRFPRAEEIGATYAARAPEIAEASVRSGLARVLRGRRRKMSRLRKNVARDRTRLASFLDAGELGELLKTALHQVKRGDTSVEVMDWAKGEARTVPLDPSRTPQANLERLFARAKKARRGLPQVDARLARLDADLAALDDKIAKLEGADPSTLEAWAEAEGDALEGVRLQVGAPAAPARRAHPLDAVSRRFDSVDGVEIRVGKGAKANDRLTLSGAKGDDIWLHARGTTGAHVLLRNEKGRTPSREALLDAAHLAAHYSTAKNDAKVEVIYTEARHVKKVKGAPAGQVGVGKSKTLLVSMDATRLDRLLGRTGG